MLPSRARYNQRPLAAAASVQTRTLAAIGGREQTTARTAAAGRKSAQIIALFYYFWTVCPSK